VEGPHGELGARLTDGLGGQDAHRLADLDRSTVGQIAAVAFGADPMFGCRSTPSGSRPLVMPAFSIDSGIILINFFARTDTTSSVNGSRMSFMVVRPGYAR
jgi:hypothetical protein